MKDGVSPDLLCMNCMSTELMDGCCPHCFFQEEGYQPSPHHLSLRTILNGKYLIGCVLGEGGFGITYLGMDLNLDIKIAIKEFFPTGFVTRESTITNTVTPFTGEKIQYFQSGRDKFIDEAKRLAKFYSLPGIVSIKDFFQENGTAYIVMEYVEGETLKQYLTRMGGKVPVDMIFELMKPLLNSLSEIHASGIIHRDISPDNLMLTPEGNIKLIDFGAARDFENSGNKSLSVMLKPGYAPEEQYRSRGVQGPWTDIYALCATIYRSITGVTPDESSERIRQDELKKPSQLGVSIQPHQEAALMKGMAVLQEKRYQSIGDLTRELYRIKTSAVSQDEPKETSQSYEYASDINSEDKINRDDAKENNNIEPQKLNKKILGIIAGMTLVLICFVFYIQSTNRNSKDIPASDNILPTESVASSSDFSVSNFKEATPAPVTNDLEDNDETTPVGTVTDEGGQGEARKEETVGSDKTGEEETGREEIVGSDKTGEEETSKEETVGSEESGEDEISKEETSSTEEAGKKDRTETAADPGADFTGSGNTSGNIINEGILAAKDGWIYYSFYSKLFKMKSDGSERTELYSEACKSIAVQGEWIYFCNISDGERLYKIKTDGSQLSKMDDSESCRCINAVGDWIYYSTWKEGTYKIRPDGSEKTLLISETTYNMTVIDDWIYYGTNPQFYKMKTDGSQITQIIDSAYYTNVVDGWIYYDDDGLYKIRTDGREKTQLNDVESSNINVNGDWIYYTTWSDKSKSSLLYKMRTDGSEETKLHKVGGFKIHIAGDWVYYCNPYDLYYYKIQKDGSNNKKIKE